MNAPVKNLRTLLNEGQLESKNGEEIVQIAASETVAQFLSVSPEDRYTNAFFQDFFQIGGYRFTNGFVVKDDEAMSTKPSLIGSFQWAGLFNTHYFVDKEEEMIGIIMSQMFPYNPEILLSFESGMYDAVIPVSEPSSIVSLLFVGGLGALSLSQKKSVRFK